MSPLKISVTKEGSSYAEMTLKRDEDVSIELDKDTALYFIPDQSSIPGLDADAWMIYEAYTDLDEEDLQEYSVQKAYINDIRPHVTFSLEDNMKLVADWIPEEK